MQSHVDELVWQSGLDGFQFNESKCKELRISFSSLGSLVELISINEKQIGDNLKWNTHVEAICDKGGSLASQLNIEGL